MSNQPPLSPDALAHAKASAVDCRINGGSTEDVAECAVEAYLTVAQPELQANSKPKQNFEVVNSVEELDKLPIGSIIAPFAYNEPTALLRDQFGTWAVAGLPEPYDTEKIHRALHGKGARVVYIPEVKP